MLQVFLGMLIVHACVRLRFLPAASLNWLIAFWRKISFFCHSHIILTSSAAVMIYWRLSLSIEYVPSERWMCRQIWRIWLKCYVCGRDAYFDRLGSERCCWLGRRDFVAQLSLTEASMLYITAYHFSQRRWKLILQKHRRIEQRKSKLHTPHAAFRQNA